LQAWKTIQSGISHHRKDSTKKFIKLKKKNNGTLTDVPEEQLRIQSEFFGKEIFGRNTPFDKEAINSLKQIDTVNVIANPMITIDELENALKSQKQKIVFSICFTFA